MAHRLLVVIMMVCAVTHLCFADEQLTNLNGEQDDDLLTISRHSESQSSMNQRGTVQRGGGGPGWMNVPSSAAPLESTEAEFDQPKDSKNQNPIKCTGYKFSIPAKCLSSNTVLDKLGSQAPKGQQIMVRTPTVHNGVHGYADSEGHLMKLQRKTYTLDVACAKTHAQILFARFGGKMTLKTSTEVCCNCPECSQPEYECKNQKGDKYCDETAKKNICSTDQGIKDCRKSCHRCPHNFPKCGGTCYTEDYGPWHNKCLNYHRTKLKKTKHVTKDEMTKAESAAVAQKCNYHKKKWLHSKREFRQPIISKDSEEIKLNGKDLDLSNEWQVCVAAALQEHATVEQRKGAAGDIGNMAGGGGYIGGGGGGGRELGESAGVGRRGSAGAPMMNPSFKMSANRAGNDEEVDLGESVGRRGSFSPVGSFSLTAGANRAGNDEEEEEL